MPSLLDGSKRICIAITEPNAGSDVKNISTTAEKSADGKFWIVNGQSRSHSYAFSDFPYAGCDNYRQQEM